MLPAPAAPAQPGPASATVITGGEVLLTWGDLSDNEAGFRVERSTDPAFATIDASATVLGGATTYEDAGLAPNTTYYWRVRAYNSAGASAPAVTSVRTNAIPVRPGDVAAAAVAANVIRVTWTDRSSNEAGFRIERSTSAGFESVDRTATVPAGATAYDDADAANAVTYHYRVRSYNASSASPARMAGPVATPLLPAAPTGLSASVVSGGEIDLAWADNASNETRFVLERSTAGTFDVIDKTLNLPANTTTHSDDGLAENTTYHYRLRAANGVSLSAAAAASAATLNAPKTPAGFAATVYSGTRVDLAWSDVANNEVGYVVQRSRSSSFATIDATFALPGNAVAHVDRTVEPFTTYFYRVYATSAGGNSGRPSRSVTTTDRPPADVQAFGVSSYRIDLQWADRSTTEQGFKIEASVAGGAFVSVGVVSPNKVSFSHSSAVSNTTYTYRVVAVGPNGALSRSEPVTAATLAPVLTTPVAQPPPVVTPADSNPSPVVMSGGVGYFWAENAGSPGLYRTDGTAAGTRLLKPLQYGRSLTDVNGTVYFFAEGKNPDAQGSLRGLWKSDGTEAGTVFLKDTGFNQQIESLVNLNGTLYFRSYRSSYDDALWTSDGTPEGTRIVRAFSENNGAPSNMVAFRGALYFSAWNLGVEGFEVWRSDGTAGGTTVLKDANPGPGSSQPFELVVAGDSLYFTAQSDGYVRRLWRSDGTTAGTAEVPGAPALGNSQDRGITPVGGLTFFHANFYVDGQGGTDLWRTDGTAAGTFRVRRFPIQYDAGGASAPHAFVGLGGRLLFATTDGATRTSLWSSDGTVDGTTRFAEFASDAGAADVLQMRGFAGRAYFGMHVQGAGWGLYRTDGSAAGTTRIAGFASRPAALAEALGGLAFAASDGVLGVEPWFTDGTAAGTRLIRDVDPGLTHVPLEWLTPGAGGLFYTTGDRELWWSDGTPGGTRRLKTGGATRLFEAGGKIYFAGFDLVSGWEIWRTDGTVAGTVPIADVAPGTNQAIPLPMAAVGGTLFFAVPAGDSRYNAIWRTDGTAAGTTKVTEAQARAFPDPNDPRAAPWFAASGGLLYFVSESPGNGGAALGLELWRSDGTPGGTFPLANVRPGPNGSEPYQLVDVNGTLFFTARDAGGQYALWKTNGTEATTVLVKDVAGDDAGHVIGNLTNANGTLYFNGFNAATGAELWRSDGTAAGTALVRDAVPGAVGISPRSITAVGDKVYFVGPGAGTGQMELWTSDGTEAGTRYVREVGVAHSNNPNPPFMGAAGGLLFYADAAAGQLWRSDGTARGTVQVAPMSSVPYFNPLPPFGGKPVAVVGDRVYYSHHVGANARELRYASATPPAAPGNLDLGPPANPASSHGLTWVDNAPNETGFVVDRSLRPDFATIDRSTFLPANTTAHQDPAATAAPVYYFRVRAVNAGGDSRFSNTATSAAPVSAPVLTSVIVNDGGAPRSMVTRLTLSFDQAVVLTSTSVELARRGGAIVSPSLARDPADDRKWVLTFAGPGGSLSDGVYDLRIVAAGVHAGSATGPAMVADYRLAFHRLFADADGDGDVDNADRFQLRSTANKRVGDAGFKWYFDHDGDGDVDNADLFQVRVRSRIAFKGY